MTSAITATVGTSTLRYWSSRARAPRPPPPGGAGGGDVGVCGAITLVMGSSHHVLDDVDLGRLGGGGRGQLGGDPAVLHDDDPVGHADDLLERLGAQQDADAVCGHLPDESVDLLTGSDVDAARRV